MSAQAVALQYDVSDIERMARAFAASKLFGVQNPEQAIALCLIAQAEGRHPASAAQDYHIIQGKPSKKADAMLRDFLAGGGKVEWHALDDTIADATFSHPAGGTARISWDMKRAQQAQLATPMWKKFPRQMLRSRVVSEGVRTVFPMATSGMYVPEEVAEFAAEAKPVMEAPANTTANMPIIDGEVVALPKRRSSAQAKRDDEWAQLTQEIDACQSVEDINLLVASRAWQDNVKTLPRSWIEPLQDYVQGARDAFEMPATGRANGTAVVPKTFEGETEPAH
ncbi:MAG TPA: recombinase RecT [Reyranella sp.]|nr:recombinase RecT [Reyranella sp.]